MRNLIAGLLMLVAGVAFGQESPQFMAQNAKKTSDENKTRMNAKVAVVIRYEMVEIPNHRSDAVNGSGSPNFISQGDASYLAGQTEQAAAQAIRAQAQSLEAQGDTEYGNGNYLQAKKLFNQSADQYYFAMLKYRTVDGKYIGAWSLYARALRSA